MKIMPDNIPSMIAWDKVIDEFGNTDFMFIAFGEKGKNILSSKNFKLKDGDILEIVRPVGGG